MSQQRDRIELAIEEIKTPLIAMDDDSVARLAAGVLAARRIVIISAGPGDLAMAEAMAGLVRKSRARLAVITAQPRGAPRVADSGYVIPAQTMANDLGSESILPIGAVYEIAMLVFVDLAAVHICESTGQSLDDVRARRFNLEEPSCIVRPELRISLRR